MPLYCPAPLRRGGWPICSEKVAYFTPKGRPVCSESPAVLLRKTQFTADLEEPLVNIQSWEPFIKGGNGRINLAIQGQQIKSYPITIADAEGF